MAPNAPLRLLLSELRTERLTRVVDVGANPANIPPYQTLFRLKGCEVIGFEPSPEAFHALTKKTSPREKYINSAVGDGERSSFKIYRDESFSSVFEPNLAAMAFLGSPHWGEVSNRVDMTTVTLDQLPECADIDLLKIDIQGGELAVFRGGRATLAHATAVITELRYFPLYVDEPMFGDQDVELRKQGFELHKLTHVNARCLPSSKRDLLVRHEVKDQMIDGDAVYVRDLVNLPSMSDEKVKHLCILSCSVFKSHSLALLLIDELVRRDCADPNLPGRYVDTLPAKLVRRKSSSNALPPAM
jgi:FkbM family methyltransferase